MLEVCDQLCAMPSLSMCEKRDMGAEWTTYKQAHVELSGALICSHCQLGHPKVRINFDCVSCEAKNHVLMSSRALWESLRVLKPLGYFKDTILTRF